MHLADRLDFYLVNAQAEDVLDQDTKATEAAPHLAASPEIHDTLKSMNPSEKADAKPDAAKKCDDTPNDDAGDALTARVGGQGVNHGVNENRSF